MKDNLVQKKAFDFALHAVALYKMLIKDKEFSLADQFIRSATSIGSNIEEAIAGQSRKDFIHKMSIAAKEAREARYWIKLLFASKLVVFEANDYLKEVEELINILTKIIKTSSLNNLKLK